MSLGQTLDQLSSQLPPEDLALDYLAEVLVQAYMQHKQNELNKPK